MSPLFRNALACLVILSTFAIASQFCRSETLAPEVEARCPVGCYYGENRGEPWSRGLEDCDLMTPATCPLHNVTVNDRDR